MEIIDRKENPLLNRIEIEFRWNHEGAATPSRADMLNAVASIEPGSNRDLIVIKDVNTRFGIGSNWLGTCLCRQRIHESRTNLHP